MNTSTQGLGDGDAGAPHIAVIGMAGRFPKAKSVEEFWENIAQGRECISFFSPEEVKEAACKASDASANKYGWAFRHDASNFASEVFTRGGRILAPDGQSYVFNSDAGVQSAKMIQDLFKNKCAVEIPTS